MLRRRVRVQQEALTAAGVGGSLQSTTQKNKFTIGVSDDGKTIVSLVNAIHQQLLLNSASLMKDKVVMGASWQDMLDAFACSGEHDCALLIMRYMTCARSWSEHR